MHVGKHVVSLLICRLIRQALLPCHFSRKNAVSVLGGSGDAAGTCCVLWYVVAGVAAAVVVAG